MINGSKQPQIYSFRWKKISSVPHIASKTADIRYCYLSRKKLENLVSNYGMCLLAFLDRKQKI